MNFSGRLILALAVAALPLVATPALAQGKPDKLDKEKGAGSLKDQERAALAESYLKLGKRFFEEMRYREAAEQLRQAVKADPTNGEARTLLDKTLFILGDKEAGYKDEARRFIDEREVKIKQASMEVERVLAEGLRAMERQDYPAAKERFERVIEQIRWFPYNIDKSGIRAQAEAKLEEAKEKESELENIRKEQLQKSSIEEAKVWEQRQTAYHQARVKQLFEQAQAAFDRTEYAKSERLCRSLLEQEPGHDHAAKLLDRAAHARRFKEELYTIERGMEEMKRLIEGVYEAAIPYQEIFQFPSDAEWQLVQKRAVDIQEAFERRGAPESPEEQRIRQTLSGRKVTINFPNTSFEDAINFLRDITGLNYVIAAPAAEALAANQVQINLKLRDITLKNALELILSQAKDLVYKIKHDAVYINTKDAEKADLYLRFYEVSEIVNDLPDYPAPTLALPDTQQTKGGQGGAGAILNLGGDEETPKTGIGADKLKELIDQKVAAESEGSVEYMGGLLMVRKSLDAHRKIEKLLNELRRTTGILVTVETRMIDVQDNFLEEIGIDFRGLPTFITNALGAGGARSTTGFNWTSGDQDVDMRGRTFNAFSQALGSAAGTPFSLTNIGGGVAQYNLLDDFQLQMIIDAVKKEQRAKQVDAPRVTVFNGQRSHILAIRQEAYIADVEVNQTGVTPTLKPVISVLNSGSILEARPIVSADRKFVTLEIQPTLAAKREPTTQFPLSLGNTAITIDLPTVSLNEIRSTIMVPDGGTVILGGLKNFLEEEKWAGVPILGKVPLFRNLFERKGWTDFKRSLIVLLKVDITIVREEEAKRFNKQAPLPPQVR